MATTEQTELHADALMSDPRVIQAKQMILEAVNEHKNRLQKPKEADPQLKAGYQQMLDRFASARGGKLWYPYLGSGLGNGALVELCDGSIKYDMICGIGVHYMGHSHSKVIDAGLKGAMSDVVQQGHLMQNRESLELCESLSQSAGKDFCFLSSSGVMANENALKIAFQKHAPAHRVLAFKGAFMGRTTAVAALTDKPKYRDGLPATLHVDYLPFYDHARPEESTKETVRVLKEHIARYPKQHAICVFELVQGEGGFYPGTEAYFKTVMDVLRENDIAVLADEVQSFGRTEQLFAFQHFNLQDHVDIVTMGKLGQVCATLFNEDYKPRPGLIAQTFTSTSVAIEASLAILKELQEGGYYGDNGRIAKIHERFEMRFEEIRSRHPDKIKGPYGLGSMVAFQPYDGSADKVLAYSHKLFENGVICFCAGANPMRIRFLVPALVVTDEQIDAVCQIVENTL